MNKKTILLTIISFIVSCLLLVIGANPTTVYAKILGTNQVLKNPRQLYRVYLSGESLGVIESKDELEDYIDSKQQELKDKYNVSKVYAPNDLDIIEEITYNETISNVEEIYSKIEEIKGTSSFTIDGYSITIEGIEKTEEDGVVKTDDITIYVLDKEVFTNSVNNTITAFIDSSQYNAYLSDTQEELEENEEGTIIESIEIDNNVTIKSEHIPAGEKIYLDEDELSKFLLFGTTEEQESYTVQAGDTIESISEANKLSVEEFLIANTNFKSSSDLLYPGQVVKIGYINPQFDTVEVAHTVSKETIKMETVYKDDDTQYVGYEQVEQEGKDGLALVTSKVKYINGEIKDTVPVSTVELEAKVDKVIVRGTKKKSTGSSISQYVDVPVEIGSWVWPAESNTYVSSSFGYRSGKLHGGIDITGSGYGSTVKAANNGIVTTSEYSSYNGNYVIIAHSNGYYTIYAHMATRTVQAGDIVMAGDKIGTMGSTGYAQGVHLHFGLSLGPCFSGTWVNPLKYIY